MKSKWYRSLRVVEPPAVEPVTLLEAKLHLRVDTTEDDLYIKRLIEAAREYVEVATDRSLIVRRLRATSDRFPAVFELPKPPYFDKRIVLPTEPDPAKASKQRNSPKYVPPHDPVMAKARKQWDSPKYDPPPDPNAPPDGPTVSDVSITYRVGEDEQRVLSPLDYRVDADAIPGVVHTRFNGFWPMPACDRNSVSITWWAGYGELPQDVPARLRHACLMLVSQWYERRLAADSMGTAEVPYGVRALLASSQWGAYS